MKDFQVFSVNKCKLWLSCCRETVVLTLYVSNRRCDGPNRESKSRPPLVACLCSTAVCNSVGFLVEVEHFNIIMLPSNNISQKTESSAHQSLMGGVVVKCYRVGRYRENQISVLLTKYLDIDNVRIL